MRQLPARLRLARRLLDSAPFTPARLASLSDPQLWSTFGACTATRAETATLRNEPHRSQAVAGHAPRGYGWSLSLREIYSAAPLLEGQRIERAAPELVAELDALRALPNGFHGR